MKVIEICMKVLLNIFVVLGVQRRIFCVKVLCSFFNSVLYVYIVNNNFDLLNFFFFFKMRFILMFIVRSFVGFLNNIKI